MVECFDFATTKIQSVSSSRLLQIVARRVPGFSSQRSIKTLVLSATHSCFAASAHFFESPAV